MNCKSKKSSENSKSTKSIAGNGNMNIIFIDDLQIENSYVGTYLHRSNIIYMLICYFYTRFDFCFIFLKHNIWYTL